MPLGLFLALAGGLVAPGVGGRDPKIGDRPPVLGPLDFRIGAQIADQNDLVDRTRHLKTLHYEDLPETTLRLRSRDRAGPRELSTFHMGGPRDFTSFPFC